MMKMMNKFCKIILLFHVTKSYFVFFATIFHIYTKFKLQACSHIFHSLVFLPQFEMHIIFVLFNFHNFFLEEPQVITEMKTHAQA